ncbi:MAG: SRPBCC family protein [Gaiellaceae bacterium]
MPVTSNGTATVTLPTDEQILITREFDAPKHLVYEAWTTPELVRRWWHANRGEVTLAEIDLRVGGKWRYVIVTTGGGIEVGFHGEYREIVPNERIVSTEVFEGVPQAEGEPEQGTVNTATFTEADGRTTLTVLVQAPNKEIRDAIIDSGMEAGMQDAMDLLEQVAVSLR